MKVDVRVIMVSLLSHCKIHFSCFIEALDSKGISRTLKKVLCQPDNALTLQVSLSLRAQIISCLLCKFISSEVLFINLFEHMRIFLVGLGNSSEFLDSSNRVKGSIRHLLR